MFGLPPQVKIWFQNRRYKTKRRQLHDDQLMAASAKKVRH